MSFLIVDEELREQSFGEAQEKSIAALEKDVGELNDTLIVALEQSGDNMDLMKIEVVSGGTPKEKSNKLVELHSRQAGYTDALNVKRQMKVQADRIRRGNTGAGEVEPDEKQATEDVKRKARSGRTLWDVFSGKVQEAGLKICHADLDKKSFSMALDRQVLNTLMTTDAGWPPESVREGDLILSRQRPIQMIDVVPHRPIDQEAAVYMEETTYTNAAAEVAEGASAPEATLALTQRTEMVRKIAVSLPITEEQMDDVYEVEGYVNQRLPNMLRQRVDSQLINGNGTAPNIRGFTNVANIDSRRFTRASSLLTKPLNEIHKMKTDVELDGRAMPNAIAMHHRIWEALALQETTAAGFYMGAPGSEFAMRVWGLPVIKNDSLSEANNGSAVLLGDFANYSVMRIRKDFMLEYGWSNDDFLRGQQRIRGCVRMCLVVYRPQAFGRIRMPATGSGLV